MSINLDEMNIANVEKLKCIHFELSRYDFSVVNTQSAYCSNNRFNLFATNFLALHQRAVAAADNLLSGKDFSEQCFMELRDNVVPLFGESSIVSRYALWLCSLPADWRMSLCDYLQQHNTVDEIERSGLSC